MARSHIGRHMSSSFSERVNSAAKIVMSKRRTRLHGNVLETLTMLRINRLYIEFLGNTVFDTDGYRAFVLLQQQGNATDPIYI